MVALTFDDGPSAYTSAVLARLRRVGAHATFFVVGRAVRARPATVAATVAAGQELGDHTYSHGDMRREQRRVRADELLATLALVRQATHGRGAPVLFRPPYGSTSIPINEQARALGLLPVVWTVDTRDWAGLSTAQIVQRALAGARPGAIILMHDGGGDRSRTVAALPAILRGLRRRHLVSVTVARLLRAAPPRDADLTAASLSGAGR
jgi:peptidoglycan/xylan/chitin deacetylase (PgdA/CDA1 family)